MARFLDNNTFRDWNERNIQRHSEIDGHKPPRI